MRSKLLWVLFLLGLIGDFVIVYILANFYPEYSHLKHVMSVLGNSNSPVHSIYNIWLIILGIIMCVFGGSVYFQYKNVSKTLSIVISHIIMLYGIGGCIISGIFSVNETREIVTIQSEIHGIGAGIGFVLLAFVPLFIGKLFIKSQNRKLGNISIILFIVCLLLFVVFIMSEKEQFQDSIVGYSGLWQRLLLGVMYLPLAILCFTIIGFPKT